MSIWSDSKLREPRWYGVLARVLLVTVVCTLLVFAVSLLVGIVGTVIASRLHGTRPDMTVALSSHRLADGGNCRPDRVRTGFCHGDPALSASQNSGVNFAGQLIVI